MAFPPVDSLRGFLRRKCRKIRKNGIASYSHTGKAGGLLNGRTITEAKKRKTTAWLRWSN